MIEATSCGGVVIFRGKILLLYKNYKNKYEGWVLPKGTVEEGEEYKDTAMREVYEETGVKATLMKYIGKSQYSFTVPEDVVEKTVHWYLMMADSVLLPLCTSPYFTCGKAVERLHITLPKELSDVDETQLHCSFYKLDRE